MDHRIQQLSYSTLLTLHSCPRRFQLYRMNANKSSEEDYEASVTFAFGHVVGAGIQDVLDNKSRDQVVFSAFIGWKPDLFAENQKQAKSFWLAVAAIDRLSAMRSAGFLKDYEIVYHESKPAVELGFIISLPDGFKYRGFVDGVLQHKITGEILVLECKTTSSGNLHPAMYKNSAQAIGYSIVLDNLFPDLSSYKVLYLVYKTKGMEYEPMEFAKSYLQRALWIQELLLDVKMIQLYEETGVFPMRGESCFPYYRECEYFGNCTMSTHYLTSPLTQEMISEIERKNEAEYQIKVTIEELIATQLEKA